ncbi:MAK10-like protein [Tanacetum coccineum]|uniref:MAK10-like protein n=1 Tax=Tanacetum coccineum TaxID=301880 RepID=A0ABQ5GF70_9ASTR
MLIPRPSDQRIQPTPKEFLKLVDSLDLRDQASNWLEHLPVGSITTWKDLTTRFLAQFFHREGLIAVEDPEQAFVEYASSCTDETGGDEESPYWTMIGKKESYKPRPSSDGVGAQTPYYARKDFLDCHLLGEWKISRDDEINPFKDVLVFRRMVEFLGAIPINLKSNMWESEDLIENPINWDKPPKDGDGAWHAKNL